MARCRECKQRHAVPGAGHGLLLLPLRLFGLQVDRDAWCRGCANTLNGFGILVWALLISAVFWILQLVR